MRFQLYHSQNNLKTHSENSILILSCALQKHLQIVVSSQALEKATELLKQNWQEQPLILELQTK
jgi:predicted DCC family thiol-disulfide oxidoreductase YuxK